MVTVSVTTFIFALLVLVTIGAKVGRWQNHRDLVESERIRRVNLDLAMRLNEIPKDADFLARHPKQNPV